MKNLINSQSLAAINRSLASVGECVDRHSFVEPAQPVVEHDEVAAINRSLARHGESVDNAFFEPDGDGFSQFDIEAHRARMHGELFADCSAVEVAAVNRSLDRLGEGVEHLEPMSEGRQFWGIDLDNPPARAHSADYNRRFWDGNMDGDAQDFDDLGDDERDAMNRVLCLVGEEI